MDNFNLDSNWFAVKICLLCKCWYFIR